MSTRPNRLPTRPALLHAAGIAVAVLLLSATLGPSAGVAVGLAWTVLAGKHLLDLALARADARRDNLFAQHECLEQLYRLIQPIVPFPTTRSYRGSPDLLLEIYQRILRDKPQVVVEASSGLSTVIAAYALRRNGSGRVVSLEHEAQFAEDTRRMLREHGLEALAEVHHAPIVGHRIGDADWKWYDLKAVALPSPIDLIVVDGPPSSLQKKARYPALPLLIDRLRVGGTLLLDDADRGGERRAARDWQAQHPNVRVEHLPFDKGLVVVTKLS
jgi:predicted O-methyltransferase YrrM